VNGLVEFLQKLGAARIAAMMAVTLALVGFFAYILLRFTSPTMVPLYTDLSMTDASAIVRQLEGQSVPYELRRDGSVILVPEQQASALRMRMAENGLPSGGGVGYEIFDKSDGLSATSFLQNVNKLRALEGELARSIRSIGQVDAARVHLVIPERPLFSRDAPEPSASIVLKVRGELGTPQIRAIQHLAASAVQGLKPARISIVDESGRLLADGAQPDDPASRGEEKIAGMEVRLKNQIEGIIERIVGPGRARAEVRAELDYSRVTQTSDQFDPESRVIRSTQAREETAESNQAEQGVTVGNELPNAQGQQGNNNQVERSNKSDETTNFEISRTTRTQVEEAGRLKRLSVALVVDGVYSTNAAGEVSYTPRTQEELNQLAALVRSAVGFNQERGDTVEVVNLRFAVPPGVQIPADEGGLSMLGLTKDDLMRLSEQGALIIITLLVLLLVVRPLMKRILAPEKAPEAAAGGGEQMIMADGAMGALPAPDGDDIEMPQSAAARMVEMAQVNGQIQAQTLQRVGELAANNPVETVSIIRQWLNEPATT
jgi:flagellar M-ring protein FliF